MQEKVEKYIYYISENKYRVKFLKIDKANNRKINFTQYIIGTLEDAIKLRDEKLAEYGLSLENSQKRIDIFDDFDTPKKSKTKKKENEVKKEKKEKKTAVKEATNKVDKYIYEIEKGKKYRIFIRKGGSRGQKGDYYSEVFEGTLAQARKQRDIKLAELKLKNGKGNKGNIRFLDFVKIYYKEYAEKELSPTTVDSGKSVLKAHILPEIANKPLNKIDSLTLQRMMNIVKDKDCSRPDKDGKFHKLSPTTVQGVHRVIKKILNKAVEWEFIEKNPIAKVKAPESSKTEKESYNRDQLIEVLDILKKEDLLTEVIITISICSGIRRGELVGLHLDDLLFDINKIAVNRAVVWSKSQHILIEKETKTKGSVREVPVPIFCMEIIREYLKLRERIIQRFKMKDKSYMPPDNLFLNSKGGIMRPDTATKKWLKFREIHEGEIKNDVTLHGLRHSYCSMQMNENPELAPADVQKLLGHSDLSTTFGYTHANEDKSDEAVSIFDKYYSQNGEKQVGFCQILSLYTRQNFITTKEMTELRRFLFKSDICDDAQYKAVKEYIDGKYPIFKTIDISQLNILNIWDWLAEQKEKYGDKFIISPIINSMVA